MYNGRCLAFKQGIALKGNLVAIFTDGQGRYFLDTFRTRKVVDDDIIGGLMEISRHKLDKIRHVLRFLAVFCSALSITLLIFLLNGWSEEIYDQIIAYVLAFSNFFSILLIFVFFTGAPQFVTIKDNKIYMVQDSISILVDYCITCASLSLFVLFLSMSNYYSALTFGSYYLLVFVTIVFFVYFSSNFYRLIVVFRR